MMGNEGLDGGCPMDAARRAADRLGSLDGADNAEVLRIQRGLKLESQDDASYYGTAAQRKAARMAESLLAASKEGDFGIGESIEAALNALGSISLESLDPSKKPLAAKIPLIGDLFDPAEEILEHHEEAAQAVVMAELDLERKARDLARSAGRLREMRAENEELVESLTNLIEAGRRRLSEFASEAEAERMAGERSQDAARIRKAAKMSDIARSLERRLYDLAVSRQMAMQFGPQTDMMERSAKEMGERIESSLLLALPLWRQQMAIGLELFRQARAAESKARIEGELAKALEANASGMRELAAKDPKEAARIAKEGLEKAQSSLRAAFEAAMSERDKGSERRAAGVAEIERLSSGLESSPAEG